MNDIKKASKLHLRINRYFRSLKDADGRPHRFTDEDEDTLEYRNTKDEIEALHAKNFQRYALVLQRQNRLTEALAKINECLDKIDHKAFDSLKVKISILLADGEFQ